jgi:hypothetical protein
MRSIFDVIFGLRKRSAMGWQQQLIWHEASRLGADDGSAKVAPG